MNKIAMLFTLSFIKSVGVYAESSPIKELQKHLQNSSFKKLNSLEFKNGILEKVV